MNIQKTSLVTLPLLLAASIGYAGGGEGANEGGSERGGEHGNASYEQSEGRSEEGSTNMLAVNEVFQQTRRGGELTLQFDAAQNAFIGSLLNVSGSVLTQARVEIHLSNGLELGPTPRTDIAAGQTLQLTLPAGAASFNGWTAHAEFGSSEGGEGSEGGHSETAGHAEGGEGRDPSSPDQTAGSTWAGTVNGAMVDVVHNAAQNSFSGSITNVGTSSACVVVEVNLRQHNRTIAELGPLDLGVIALGETKPFALDVSNEPSAAGKSFEHWSIHPEVSQCGASKGEAGEGSGESGGEHSTESEGSHS